MALEPITRAEQIMSGESLEPITREEMFLAKAAGMDVNTPEPITRREMFLSKISGGSGGGSGGAFQVGTVVSADGTNLVVPCTLDNILIVRKHVATAVYVAYLLNETGILVDGIKIQVATNGSGRLVSHGVGQFSTTKENGQTTFTQITSSKFSEEYCYIAWDNAE